MKKKEVQNTIFDLDGIDDVKGHGGVRKGAGRKAKEPTKTIRIPITLEDEIKALIDAYRRS